MESGLTWEYKALINELTQGMEKANQLRLHLYSSEAPNMLLQNVLASYENALFILKRSQLVLVQAKPVATLSSVSEPSISVNGSPKSQEAKKNLSDQKVDKSSQKKRKMKHTWTDEVRVISEKRLEGPKDDGYSWRKYGQKDILGAKYPRSYYRCTYRLLQDCCALKQVQRSDDDPAIFDITYKGTHTCRRANNTIPRLESLEKREQNETLLKLKANLRVDTDDLVTKNTSAHLFFPSTFACHENENYYYPTSGLVHESQQGAFSSLFYSPSTSESENFSAEMYQMIHDEEAPNLQHSEIISAFASKTNSPIAGMEFPFDRVDLASNFSFDALGFYTSSKF